MIPKFLDLPPDGSVFAAQECMKSCFTLRREVILMSPFLKS